MQYLTDNMQFYRPLKDWRITQSYGVNPYRLGYGASGHPGIDLRASFQTPVLAAQDGIVIAVKDKPPYDAYGKHVVIAHKNEFYTIYGHLDVIDVKVNQFVLAGSTIGLSGGDWRKYSRAMRRWYFGWNYTAAGYSTALHLHFEIRIGKNDEYHHVNPTRFLLSNYKAMLPKEKWHEDLEKFCLENSLFRDEASLNHFVETQGGNGVAHQLIAFTIKAGHLGEKLEAHMQETSKDDSV